MKKALIVTTIGKKLNFGHLYMINPLQSLGYSVYWGANFKNLAKDDHDLNLHYIQLNFHRNPFDIRNIVGFFQLKKALRTENFDIIHCNTPSASFYSRIASINSKSRIYYTAHGFHFYKGSRITSVFYKFIEKVMSKFTNVLITMNKEDFEASQKFKTNARKYIIPGVGIDTSINPDKALLKISRSDFDIQINDFLLVTVGELNKNKNQIVMLKALKKLSNKQIHLILCGVGKKEKQLKKYVKRQKMSDNVHFLGFRKDVLQVLLLSDLFILMSKREGLPRSIQEAMHAGLPCIVSDTRGSRDLVIDGFGGYVIKNDAGILATKIIDLFDNKDEREKFGKFNQSQAAKYDFKIVVKQMSDIYEENKI